MHVGIILLNFGEPERATLEEVTPFLERIFRSNAALDPDVSEDDVVARSRRLAEERAPGLVEEYREIGGSPLNAQARWQAEALEKVLGGRGHPVQTFVGMQFTEPSIEEAVGAARDAGVEKLICLPVYPLCGPSTTVAALASVEAAADELGWEVERHEITGWHRHPDYIELRADAIQHLLEQHNLYLGDPGTRLVFSAHGTPLKYLEEGSRYDVYVRDFCRSLAKAMGVAHYSTGFQNHTNRPDVEWTQPDVEQVIRELDGERVVVDAVSFMHEQSETLSELDDELREVAEEAGLDFYRVPIPHDAPAFIEVLADLVQPFMTAAGPLGAGTGAPEVGGVPLRQCICRSTPGTRCLNAELHR